MKVQLLPGSFESGGVSKRQRLTTYVLNDKVAIDAGSLAFACNDHQRNSIRDVILSHTHLDHIAGLPIFVDDLFSTLEEPIKIHGTKQAIDVLETHIFNWDVYPKFSELRNDFGPVLEYREFEFRSPFRLGSLEIEAIAVDHQGPSAGFLVRDASSVVVFSGDTSETGELWTVINELPQIDAVLVECSFPNRLGELASASHHLTPLSLSRELAKINGDPPRILVTNIKASFRDEVIEEILELDLEHLEIMNIGEVYEF